jgi:hypothetical protein
MRHLRRTNLMARVLLPVIVFSLYPCPVAAQEVVTVAAAAAAQQQQQQQLEPQPLTVNLPPEETPLAPEVTNFIKGMALLLLPSAYTDDDDWNRHKRVQSGLNVEFDGLKLDTSRRWKDIRHGTWQRVDATLVDPEHHFQLAISLLPRTEKDEPRYRVRAKMRLRARLYSMSADIVTDVSFDADLHFQSQLLKSDSGTRLRVLPHIEAANASVDSFSLRSVSHAKGGAVREFGNLVEAIVKRAVEKKNEKLPTKINGKILKKPERFEIPAGILALVGGTPTAVTKDQ